MRALCPKASWFKYHEASLGWYWTISYIRVYKKLYSTISNHNSIIIFIISNIYLPKRIGDNWFAQSAPRATAAWLIQRALQNTSGMQNSFSLPITPAVSNSVYYYLSQTQVSSQFLESFSTCIGPTASRHHFIECGLCIMYDVVSCGLAWWS